MYAWVVLISVFTLGFEQYQKLSSLKPQ